MTIVLHPTRSELTRRRQELLDGLGLTAEELADRAAAGGLLGDEWSVWAEVEEIDYLLAT